MSEFFKLAYDLLAKVIYNLVSWIVAVFTGFVKLFVTGWADYFTIFKMYFPDLTFIAKLLGILLMIILVAVPVLLLVIIIRGFVLRTQLKAVEDDSSVLYREIGRLNKQVIELNEEKTKILNMKVANATGGAINAENIRSMVSSEASGMPVLVGGGVALADPLAEPVGYAGAVAGANISDANIGEDALSAATAAAVNAVATARIQSEENERNSANRFPKLSMVDLKYADYEAPDFNYDISLEQFVENYRLFACSQFHLYYTPEIIRRFVAGMSASRILILEGISGTGKTSLPYSFSRYLNNPATIVSVQPSFRDRSELIGYFNEFSKQFKETEFLRALYEGNYREDPGFIVLDEMNLARVEYYFAEMLSVLELPNKAEWTMDLVPTAWPGDPEKLSGGKLFVPNTIWYVGTANNDDSTFTITDKVYDRAIPIEINERADAFECPPEPYCAITCRRLEELFAKAREDHPISTETMAQMLKLDAYLQTRFKLAFGNRIMKQMYDFIPVYVACGGTELGGLDYIIARKVLKKFESLNVGFMRDEIMGLKEYMEKIFGKDALPDSEAYLDRIKNLY